MSAPATSPFQRIVHAIKASVDAQEFPRLPPWYGGRNDRERDVVMIRSIALRLIQQQGRDPNNRGILFRVLAWPLLLPVKAWRTARDPEQPGFLLRFLRGCLDLAYYNLRPDALRAIRRQRSNHSRLARLYVADRENQALLIELHQRAPSAKIGNKIVFHQFCSQQNFAHIPVLAHGTGARFDPPAHWPAGDIFAKSADLWCGQGAELLLHQSSSGVWQDRRGHLIAPTELGKWAAEIYGEQSWLLQPSLRVDPSWSSWSPGPLGTVRIVTIIVRPGDAPEVIAASMRLPRDNMIVDNFSAGALSAEIDWHTGRLGPALGCHGARRWHDIHPDTGARITGAIVPDWTDVCTLACAAHAAASDLTAVGWDVSCYQGAPVLVEANPIFNLAPTVILGETRWLEAMRIRQNDLNKALEPPDKR